MHGTSHVSGPGQISGYKGQTTEKSWFNSRSRTRNICKASRPSLTTTRPPTAPTAPSDERTSGFTPPLTHKPSTMCKETTLFTFIHVKISLTMMGKGTKGMKHYAIHLILPELPRNVWPADSGVPRNFVRGGGVQQIRLRTEYIQNGDLGAIAL